MSLGTRRNRERRQRTRRFFLGVGKWLLIVVVLGAIGYEAHRTGSRLARSESERLAVELAAAQQQAALLGQDNARLRLELDQARQSEAGLQQRYDADIPTGTLADLLAETRTRLQAGLDGERLRQVILEAEPVRRCDGPAVFRRFRISAGTRLGPDDGTTFAEGLIRVAALAPVIADDMARNAVVTFSGLGSGGLGSGGPASATGMPASHVFVLNNLELQLRVTESPIPGFATATLTTCRIE